MTDFKEEGFKIDALDLKNDVSPGTEDDHRVYNHDGTSTLTLTDGSTTSKKGWYMWSNPDNSWFPMGQHADLVDGYHGADLAALAENETVSGKWTFGSDISIGLNSVLGADGKINFKNNGNDLSSTTAGTSPLRAFMSSGTKAFDVDDNGHLSLPNGNAYVSGARVQEGEHNPVSIPVTKWADGLSSEEVHRISVPTGKSLYVYGLEIAVKGGGGLATPSNLTIDIYDATNATVVASDSANGSMTTGTPIGSSGSGAEVLFRLSNSSGSYQNASIQANVVIK